MNIEELFEKAVKHRDEHDCSAYPYENGDKLLSYLKQYNPNSILEIGTGIGYTSCLMALALPEAEILTIEKDLEHVEGARKFLHDNSNDPSTDNRVTIIAQPAEGYLESLTGSFDFIFFDGYQIHYEFLPHYKRLLKSRGILFLGNNHLQSRTSKQFFEELNNGLDWEILEQFAETTVAKRK